MKPILLDFEKYRSVIKTRNHNGHIEIWDILRKKWLNLLPEEWVRQSLIQALIQSYQYSKTSIAIEKEFTIHQKKKRFDAVVFDKNTLPYIIIECKAFQVNITQEVFDQLSLYNLHIKAPYLMVTNGILTYCFEQNHLSKDFTFLTTIPEPK